MKDKKPNITMITTIELQVEASGFYDPGREAIGMDPPESAELKNFKVLLRKSNLEIDITEILPTNIVLDLEDDLIEEYLRSVE